jgi:dipeptidyl aminopeptidase/acylaminoacyl peptidase
MFKTSFIVCTLLILASYTKAQSDQLYQLPPKEILELADVKPRPGVIIDDQANFMLITQRNSIYQTLEELSEEEYKLGGLRINPANFGISRSRYINNITVKNIKTGTEKVVDGLPEKAMIGNITYSHDQSKVAFSNNTGTSLELWILDIPQAKATRIENIQLNGVLGRSIQWIDNQSILAKIVNIDNRQLLSSKNLPLGPVVQESKGEKAPNRTYQDLLKDKTDENNFDYFTSANLVKIDLTTNTQTTVVSDKRFSMFRLSPDKQFILLQTIERPYSYLVPLNRFAQNISVIDLNGKLIHNLTSIPLAENLSISFDAVRQGVRNATWRDDKPNTLVWIEALDEGNPSKEVEHRDALYALEYPFTGTKMELLRTVNRIVDVTWGDDNTAIAIDSWRKNRNTKTYLFNPSNLAIKPKIIFDRMAENLYDDPGDFVVTRNAFGNNTLLFSKNKKALYLSGEGYSEEGNRPFIDEYNLSAGQTKRLWRAEGKSTYESIQRVINMEKGLILTTIESIQQNPNYYLRTIKSAAAPQKITNFPHPYESFKAVYKEKITYQREDGVQLTATLYLPAGYDRQKGEKLPVIMWAYPQEFKSADNAGQVRTSPHTFTYLSYGTPIYWAARGYAILDNASFPIVGEGDKEPNDTYIPQLVANAKAAIDAVDKMGYIDRSKVAVGGHSYGAFMTANLLTHSDLFACGVARSGAYNRSLTPFGFQSEERTYWQAPEVYHQMAPYNFADQTKAPLLLIHGSADNNPGTFTLQSERYFQALKGHGAYARLVLLPFESHGYAARENIMHVLWEQDQWFEKYLRNKK